MGGGWSWAICSRCEPQATLAGSIQLAVEGESTEGRMEGAAHRREVVLMGRAADTRGSYLSLSPKYPRDCPRPQNCPGGAGGHTGASVTLPRPHPAASPNPNMAPPDVSSLFLSTTTHRRDYLGRVSTLALVPVPSLPSFPQMWLRQLCQRHSRGPWMLEGGDESSSLHHAAPSQGLRAEQKGRASGPRIVWSA